MIAAYGGPAAFYGDFFINSLSPLGFVSIDDSGREKNYNYYDSPALYAATEGYIKENIRNVSALGVHPGPCVCFGTGKNESILRKLNNETHSFAEVVALEHPRYIVQYKQKQISHYIDKYLETFRYLKENYPATSS